MSSGHSLSTDRSGTETGAMPSLGGTALAVGCLSESMEGALREHGALGEWLGISLYSISSCFFEEKRAYISSVK